MSTELLVILTVVEIVALVVVLAVFVILITQRLRSIAALLRQVSRGAVSRIHGDVFLVAPGAGILNQQLNTIASALPAIAAKAESLPPKQTQTGPHARAMR